MIGVKFWDYSGVESSSIVGDKLTPSPQMLPSRQ